jgi:tetratricopeptide (TPR) repeat protein
MRPTALLLVLLLWPLPSAHAAGTADDAARDPREAQARSYFTIGLSHYRLGELEEAIQAFQAGYRCKPQPLFLFNIAQAARKSGHIDMAIDYYQQYLEREPLRNAQQRTEAEEHLRDLRRLRAAQPPPPPAPTAPPEPAPIPSPPTPSVSPSLTLVVTPPARRPVWKQGWLWGTLSAVVVVGVGVGVGTWLGLQPRPPEHPSLGTVAF